MAEDSVQGYTVQTFQSQAGELPLFDEVAQTHDAWVASQRQDKRLIATGHTPRPERSIPGSPLHDLDRAGRLVALINGAIHIPDAALTDHLVDSVGSDLCGWACRGPHAHQFLPCSCPVLAHHTPDHCLKAGLMLSLRF